MQKNHFQPIFSYSAPHQGIKFPAWLCIYANEDNELRIYIRGTQFVLADGFAEPGHLEEITLPKDQVQPFIDALQSLDV